MNMHSLVNARESIGYMEKSGANLSQSLKRLSTGIKVDAKDAGGLAVSTKMDSVITRTRTLGENVQNGMSFLESQDAAQSKLGAILTRMSELRVRYDDPTMNTSDGANLNREFKELQDDVRTLAQKKFNGISLFSSGSDADSKLVIGANSANPSNVREVTRNQFFNSLLDTQSSGGPQAGSKPAFAKFGSFTDRAVNATGGTASGGKVNGLQGSVPGSPIPINWARGSATIPAVNGVATGTTTDLTINGEQGTFTKIDVHGAQGTTSDFTLSGTPPSGTGATATVTTIGGGAGGTPTAVWTKNFPGGTDGFDKMSPVIDKNDNNNIFIGLNADNKILQLDASGTKVREYDLGTGKNMSWKVALADTSTPGTTDTLYAASGDGKQLFAFHTTGPNAGNVKTGWPVTVGTASHEIVESPPFVHKNGNVYVMTNGGDTLPFPPAGKLHGYDKDGNRIKNSGGAFTFPINFSGKFSGGFAEATDGTLIVTGYGAIFNDKSIQAVDPLSGTDKWRVEHGTGGTEFGAVKGPPVIVGNSVVVNTDLVTPASGGSGTGLPFVPEKKGRVVAINLTTQAQTTLYNSNDSMEGGPAKGKSEGIGHATATDAVFVATSNGMAAIAVGGGTLWTVGGFNATTCTPVYDSTNNLVWVTDDDDGDVVAMRTVAEGGNAAGTEKHRISPQTGGGLPAAAGSKSSPAIDSSGNVYLGYNNGNVTRISASGTPITLQAVNVGTGFTSAPLPTDITLTQKTGTLGAIGTLAVDTVTINLDTSLKITFKGAATAAGATYEVTAPSSTITPPADVIKGSNYLSTDTPAVRVLAEGIGDKSATLRTGLVALIDGDTAPPTGAGTIADSSGNVPRNDGNVAAGEAPTHETTDRRSGGGAYVFDGTDDKINLGTLNTEIGNSAPGAKNKLTISAWVSRNGSEDHRIVCKSSTTSPADHIFSLGIFDNNAARPVAEHNTLRIRIGTMSTNATDIKGSIAIPDNGTWTHVAMTYDGTEVRSYVNGVLDPATTTALTGNIKTSLDDVYIGNVNNSDLRYFDGKLDDVGIWNRALTEIEIKELAGPGNLTATASVNDGTSTDLSKVLGTLTINPTASATLATTGPFTVEVDDGVMRNPADFPTTIGPASQLYDAPGDTVGSTKNVIFSGGNEGNLAATATVRSDGQLDIKFTTGAPSGTGNFTMTVDPGAFHLDDPPPQGSGYLSGETPAYTITGAHSGATGLAGTATVITTAGPDFGKLNVDLSGVQPTGTGNLTLSIADGFKAPADLLAVGSGYDATNPEADPTVTVTGADKGTLTTGTATIITTPGPNFGKLNITFPTNKFPTGPGNLTVTVTPGVLQHPVNLTGIGSDYADGETPAFTVTDGDLTDATTLPVTTTGTATVTPGTGKLNVDLSGIVPTGTGDLNLTIDPGALRAPDPLIIGSGYDGGPPAEPDPNVLITDTTLGADQGTLGATAKVRSDGQLDITFTGAPTGTGDITLTIDDGVGNLANQTGGSGYVTGDAPAVTILDPTGNPLVAPGVINTSVNGTGTLTVDLSAVRTNVQGNHKVQIADGTTLQTPDPVTGIGAYHDPANPPTVTITGADVGGVTVNTVTVNSSGTVDVSFAGTPSGTGPLAVTVSGGSGTGSTAVSSKYLLDIDGDLWDYTVSEFESFTELVSDARAQNGAEQNSLGTFWELLSTNVNKLEQAAGRIKDADFAKEMTEVSKSQINTRSAAVMLGKQNRITSEALLTLQNLSNML